MKLSVPGVFACALLAGCGGDKPAESGGGGATDTIAPGGSGGGGASGGTGGTTTTTTTEEQPFSDKLAAIPGVTILGQTETTNGDSLFLFTFEQPADHDDPNSPTFPQQVSLLHRDPAAPMILGTTGYDLYYYEMEPTALLQANQLIVEHRWFPPSRPDPADWTFLRIRQAAADHHDIVTALRPLYSGKWLSTGASKGGMTSVYHRRFFPADVDGTVAYVAPQSYGDSDPRYIDFLNNVGPDQACRDALKEAQKIILSRRPEMTARMIAESGAGAYTHLGVDGALDYAVIELPFGFWQYGSAAGCDSIPKAAATDDQVWTFLNNVDAPQYWDDQVFEHYEPYYFQAAVELGYPGYDASHLEGLLTVSVQADVASAQVAPGPTKEMALDVNAMPDIADWLSQEGDRMLFIYGENDPYSAAAFELGGAKESYRFFVPGGNHGASIVDLPEAERATALSALEAWTGVTPKPVPPQILSAQRLARLRRRGLSPSSGALPGSISPTPPPSAPDH